MRNILSPIAGIAVLAAILSCSEERIGSNPDGMVHGITVTGTDFVQDQDTRAAYTVDNSGFHFTWTAGDTVGIYPVGADQVAFPISSGDGSQTAQFDGGAWALRADRQYAAYYPFDVWNYLGSSTSIPVSYIGQTQNGNASTAHLDRYDFMASAAVKPDLSGCVNITMKHLGSFVRFQLTMPQADTYSQLTLTDCGSGFVTAGTYNLSSQTPAIKSAGTSKTISMDLKNVSTTSAGQTITLYMMLAPGNMSGHTIELALAGKNTLNYTASIDGKDMTAGKAYSYDVTFAGEHGDSGEGEILGHAYVDLGLPSGILWASCDMGATSPEGTGDRYAWGELSTKSSYSWSTYNGYKASWTEKNTQFDADGFPVYYDISHPAEYPDYGPDICGTQFDVAQQKWGGFWHMPTDVDWQELRGNCDWSSTTKNGVSGYKVTSKTNGRWIFIPSNTHWTSTMTESDDKAKTMSGSSLSSASRYYGYYVRPVYSDAISKNLIEWAASMNRSEQLNLLRNSIYPLNAVYDISCSSSNPTVASVSSDGLVTANAEGFADITVNIDDDTYNCSVVVFDGDVSRLYVDLGLSVKWATCNLGASRTEDYGDYFAWGETEPYYEPGFAQSSTPVWKSLKSEGYDYPSYRYCTYDNSYSSFFYNKYCSDSSCGFNGYTDSKTVLDPEDDAAHVNWGGSWRMPTKAEQDELRNNCTWTWTTINGIKGYKVQSNKSGYTDRWIFLPAAGYRYGTYLRSVGSNGYCWSSSLRTSYPGYAYYLGFYSYYVDWSDGSRGDGQSVRPVCQ